MSDSTFSDFSAQDTQLASLEAQEWIEAAVDKKFRKNSFRESLEDGVLLCELMNKVSPGAIRRINKSKSPIAYLDNIQQFLHRCQDFGLNDAQLFDTMDLQEIKVAKKVGVKRNEADRRIRSVCITLYWLGRAVAELDDYTGPQLDLILFKKLMEGNFSEPENEDKGSGGTNVTSKQLNRVQKHEEAPRIKSPTAVRDTRIESPVINSSPVINGTLESNGLGMIEQEQTVNAFEQEQTADELGMTFEQEQTADELLADIQNAVDEMLQDFQTSPVAVNPPTVAPKKIRDLHQKKIPQPAESNTAQTKSQPSTELFVHMKSKNGGFGFQIMGGVDSDLEAQVDYIVPGSPADNSGLKVGDMMIHVNRQNMQHLSHVDLVSVIKEAGQIGEVTLGINRTASNSVESTASHSPLNESKDSNFGFSRRESREKWEEENEERERQAQEIALLYPHRSAGSHPIENGHALGPPTTFGTIPLPPLVEHQEEALFEQFQEMIDAAPSPFPSPPASPKAEPSLPSTNSSHPVTPLTISPSNLLQDDKETLEREIEELALMEAAKPSPEDTLSFSTSEEIEDDRMSSPRDEQTKEQPSRLLYDEQDIQSPIELESEESVAVKYDSFRVEELNSPQPLSPITEVSQDAEVSPDVDIQDPSETPPPYEDPAEMFDRELDELLKFSQSSSKANTPQPEMVVSPMQNEEWTHSDVIVTPPPMFDSPPPPKPKSEAPKRVVKRPAPPPPKPKPEVVPIPKRDVVPVPKPEVVPIPKPEIVRIPKPEVVPIPKPEVMPKPKPEVVPEPNPEATPIAPQPSEQEAPIANTVDNSPPVNGMVSDDPFQRSQSPDLVTQMQELAYSKGITSSADWGIKGQLQSETKNPPPSHHFQKPSPQKMSSLPRNMPAGVLNQLPYYHQNQAIKNPSRSLAFTSNGSTSTPNYTESTVPKLIEVVGDIKIQHVMKKRWTPKSSSAEPSPIQTPEYQQTTSNYLSERSATLPNFYNGNGHTSNGGQRVGISSVVMAKGIGSGIGRPGVGQNPNKFQPIPAKGNPYQQSLQQQQQLWQSQEELRGNYNQQKANQYARQRLTSTPEGTRDYKVQKSMSLPRGSMGNSNRANTFSTNRGGVAPIDGYQVAYTTQASNPHDLCSRCHQSLGPGTVLALPSLKTVYHVKCFVCRVCRGPLTQGGQSTSVMIKKRQPHCGSCISGDNGTQTTEC